MVSIYVLLILTAVLAILLIAPLLAYAYTMNPLGFHLEGGTPLFCYWDSDYNIQMETALLKWQGALFNYYGSGYTIEATIIYPSTDVEIIYQCTAHLIMVDYELTQGKRHNAKDGEPILGIMLPQTYNGTLFVYIFEERSSIMFETLIDFQDSITRTIMHEMGHTFGLGHFNPDSMQEALRPWPSSLMWNTNTRFHEPIVDEATMLAFDCWYGGMSSWMGKHPDFCKSFTIGDLPRVER